MNEQRVARTVARAIAMDAGFEESKHPRGEGGKFSVGQHQAASEAHRKQYEFHKEKAQLPQGRVDLQHSMAGTHHFNAMATHKRAGQLVGTPDYAHQAAAAHRFSKQAVRASKRLAAGKGLRVEPTDQHLDRLMKLYNSNA